MTTRISTIQDEIKQNTSILCLFNKGLGSPVFAEIHSSRNVQSTISVDYIFLKNSAFFLSGFNNDINAGQPLSAIQHRQRKPYISW